MAKVLSGAGAKALLCVLAWKAALVLFFALPVPSNDSFFYDGAVVHFLEAGKYCNPAIRLALPISGGEVFAAYPPLYQLTLLGWMFAFGTSALSAMVFHLVLFGVYAAVLFAVLSLLEVRPFGILVASLFLLAITFNDRPDSLAHVFGIMAVYAWVRWAQVVDGGAKIGSGWAWVAAVGCVLAIGTGLQIGGLYSLVILSAWVLSAYARRRVPWLAAMAIIGVPVGLAALVISGYPRLWEGFLEHAQQTPSFTGFRIPAAEDFLKMGRNVSGILLVGAILLLHARWLLWRARVEAPGYRLLLAATVACVAIILGSMVVLTPNALTFTLYLQPLIVALCLRESQMVVGPWRFQAPRWAWLALGGLASIRAVGLTTWGIAGVADCGYGKALERVRAEIAERPPGTPVVLSSAYLYEAYRQDEFAAVHSDWMLPGERSPQNTDYAGILKLKPGKVIITPFDYYRRYEPLFRLLTLEPHTVRLRVHFAGSFPPPDAYPKFRRVVQHTSWAPVIVSLDWMTSDPPSVGAP